MCGIAGVIHCGQLTDTDKLSNHFLTGLNHRGPDSKNIVNGEGYLFMHTRLSIIDLTPQANQPFESSDGRYVIVYNGEIYNYKQLKLKLEHSGCRFKTNSDTEVLLQAFIVWKENVVYEIDGMFAFAVFDKLEKKIFAARDRVGKKPFYYCHTSSLFCFASESDVIANSGLINKRLSLSSINCFLAIGYLLSPSSLYEDIYQLEAGTYLWFDASTFVLQKTNYWSILPFYETKTRLSQSDAIANIKHLLQTAVQKRLVADVDVGVLLSGGLDSSILAAIAVEQQVKLKTFTAAFSNVAFNESHYAELLSKHIGAEHFAFLTPPVNQETMLRIIDETDGALADTSILALNPLAQHVSKHVKAVLCGDGADELFGGYDTYRAFEWRNRLRFLPLPIWNTLQTLPLKSNAKISLAYKWKKFFSSGNMDDITAHYHFREHNSINDRIQIMGKKHEALIRDTNPLTQFRKYHAQANNLCNFEKLLYVDFKTWLPDNILVKTDRACMRWGLEVRCPYLDRDLVEFTASLPVAYKMQKMFGKVLLKRSFGNLLPPSILHRKKSGFNVPMSIPDKKNRNEYKLFNNWIYKHKIEWSV